MSNNRRHFLQLLGGAALAPTMASAETYPSRPVRIIAGFAPGTATDIAMRLIAQPLGARLGQEIVVENKPGAASNIAAEFVVRSPPDGTTLLAMTVTNAINATFYPHLNFDIARDIVPVIATFQSPETFVVHPSVPAKTIPEFIAYAKANPGKLNYASSGYGSAPNMAAELFKLMTGVNMLHVPYRSSLVPDLLAGQVQVFIGPMPVTIAYVRAGKLRALGVTSAKPSSALPGVPTVAEFVPGYEASIWHGIGAPKGTPQPVVDRLNEDINAVLAAPDFKAKFARIGGVALGGTPAEYGTLIKDEIAKWGKVVREAKLAPHPAK